MAPFPKAGATLRKDERLRRRREFAELYRSGESLRSEHAVLVYLRTGEAGFRGAVVASKKVGSAVRRNRAKRLLREAHRAVRNDLRLDGTRLALIARRTTPDSTARQVSTELRELYRRAGFVEEVEE